MATLVVSAARTSWTLRRENGSLQNLILPAFPEPENDQRLMIVSPHPDDETLGCGGLIRLATERGVPLKIVIVTNGDDFPWAVQRRLRTLRPTTADYIRFGQLRQSETLNALRRLGVPRSDVIFLGYPDRGLSALWMSHWSANNPFASASTRQTHNPYRLAYHPHAAYTGVNLTEDLRGILEAFQPTDLFFTHPNDEHPDHAVIGNFVVEALQSLKRLSQTRLHTFLVHRGSWPTPQGYRSQLHLPPPEALAQLDTRWRTLPLSRAVVKSKADALWAYDSQLKVQPGARFLFSFVRRNELFGEFRYLQGARSLHCGPRYATPWQVTVDPIHDKLTRDYQPGADLEEVAVMRSGDELRVRVVMRGDLSRWAKYQVNLHRLDGNDSGGAATLSLTFRLDGKTPAPVTYCLWEDDAFDFTVPLKALGNPAHVMVNAETDLGGMTVDRAAWRGFDLQ